MFKNSLFFSPQSFKLSFSYAGLNSIWNLLVYIVWGKDIFLQPIIPALERRVLPLYCHLCYEPSSHLFMSVFLGLFHQSLCLSTYKYQISLFSKKTVLTDTLNDIILWERCDHLQEEQCSKSMTMSCAILLGFLPICQSIQRHSEENPEHTGLLGQGKGGRLG